jgi:hypothetical protein
MLSVKRKYPWPESASELYRPIDRRLSTKLVPTFAHRGCHVVSATDPYGRILDLLNRSRYFFFQVAPQLSSRGWADPVPDLLLLSKSGSPGNVMPHVPSYIVSTLKLVSGWPRAHTHVYRRHTTQPLPMHLQLTKHARYTGLHHHRCWIYPVLLLYS